MKSAYLFRHYYTLAIAPLHLWGFIGDQDQRVCESCGARTFISYLILSGSPLNYRRYLLNVSMNRFTCFFWLLITHLSDISSVILLLRTYAFSGRKKWVLAVLSITFAALDGFMFWVMSRELSRLYRGLVYRAVSLTLAYSVPRVRFDQSHRLFRRFRLSTQMDPV